MIAELILLGTLQATSYRPVARETKPECTSREHCRTANNENVSQLGIAISQDYLDAGIIHYGDCVYVDHVGYRIVNDCLNRRITKSVDIFVYTLAQERAFGVKHLRVWLVKPPQENENR